jgi:uncharacterized membrane protein YdbT with pleckstrin-like domain
MSRYVESSLLADESVVFETHLHWSIYFIGCVFAALAFVTSGVTLLIAVPALIGASIRQSTSEFAVTEKRVLVKTGWISRRTIELNLSKVESVDVSQGMFGRVLDYGTITVVGTGSTKQSFRHIAKPLEFRRAIQSQQSLLDNQFPSQRMSRQAA